VVIRKARESDVPAIKKLVRANPRQLVQSYIPATVCFYVAEEEGVVVGCCALEVYSKKIAEIRTLAIKKVFRRQGIATALIKKCVAEARRKGVKEVLAITGAVKLFEKQGFGTFHQEKYAMLKMLK
jgi:amino-acid N-acetyltransferase